MKPITYLLCVGLLCLSVPLISQVSTLFTPASPSAPVGSNVTLQLKVVGFTNIQSIQFPISYDKTLLEFVSLTNPTLPDFSVANYFNNSSQGTVTISWQADAINYPSGVTVPGNNPIFDITFKVKANGVSVVNLANVQPGIEFVNAGGTGLTVSYQNGASNVTGGSGGFKIIANTVYIAQGDTACMPVTVNGFDSIVAMQYVMHWDTTKFKFVGTQGYNLPNMTKNNFNGNVQGNLVMFWDDPSGWGITRNDGDAIYEVCFTAIGPPGSSSIITFDSIGLLPGTPADATRGNGQNVWTINTPVKDTIFVTADPNAVTFIVDKDTALINSQVCSSVKVRNFKDIVSIQFGVGYDPTRLQFQSIDLGANPLDLVVAANFLTNNPGQVRFSWVNSPPVGLTLPDNTTLFSVCYTALGPNGTTTPVNITNFTTPTPLPIEIVKDPGGPVTPNLNNGFVHMIQSLPCAINVDSIKNVSCFGGNNGQVFVTATGGSSYTYKWAGPGINAGNMTMEDPTNLSVGTYTVTVTANGGCTATNTATVTGSPDIQISISAANVKCNGGSDGSINITATGGMSPYFYTWSGPGVASTSEDQMNLKAGNFRVTVTDNKGCQKSSPQIQITQPTAIKVDSSLKVTPITCFGASTGAIDITPTGGSGGYSYKWSNGPTTQDISNLPADLYQVTVTDNSACTGTATINLTNPPQFTVNSTGSTNVTCLDKSDGSVSIATNGGVQPLIYVWKNTITNLTVSNLPNPANLPAGTYNVTVSDQNGCTTTLSQDISITAPSDTLNAQATVVNVTCGGGNDGSISLAITGGWGGTSVTWIPSIPGGANPTQLTAGTYTPILNDIGGCRDTLAPITLVGPDSIKATVTKVNVSPCGGDNNGSITLSLSGGNGAPYTVQWNGGLTGNPLTAISGGNYVPIITDQVGCTTVLPAINIFEPPVLDTSSVVIVDKSGSVNNGSIVLTMTGGVLPYTYNWNGPGVTNATTQNLNNLDAGNYTVVVTDGFNCTYTLTVTVKSDVGVVVDSIADACGNDGCIYMTLSPAAVPPFQVTGAGTGPQIFTTHNIALCGLPGGTYNLTISDNNGSVLNLPPQQVDAKQPSVFSSMANNPNDDFKNGSILLTGVPTATPYQFVWNDGFNGNARINLDSGTYCVTATNLISGCTSVECFELERTYPPFMYNVQEVQNADCNNTENGSIAIAPSGGDGPGYTYQWTGPNGFTATTKNISGLSPGTYFLSVTDESMIIYDTSFVVGANSTLAVSNVNETSNYNGFQVSGANTCDGSASVVITGSVGNVSVVWSNGTTGVTNTTLCAGTYGVTITDGLGCQATWIDSLTAPAPIAPENQPVSDFGGFNVSCNGACDGIMRVSVSGGVPPYEVQWPTGEVDILNNSNAFSTAMNLCGGDLLVTVTDGNNIVTVYTVTVLEPDPLIGTFSYIVPTRFTTCDGELLLSAPGAVGVLDAVWSSNNGQQGQGVRASGLCAGEVVQFVAEDENGCRLIASDTVPYPEDGCLIVRPVITPGDQDGNNDYLLITCIESVPDNTVEIYNRWGQLVLPVIESYHNTTNRWEGRSGVGGDGAPLPEGVYYYVLHFTDDEGNRRQQKGYINLLR